MTLGSAGNSRSLASHTRTYVIDYQWPGFRGAVHEDTQGMQRRGETEASWRAAGVPNVVSDFTDELEKDDSVTNYMNTEADLQAVRQAAIALADSSRYSSIVYLDANRMSEMPGGDPLLRVRVTHQE